MRPARWIGRHVAFKPSKTLLPPLIRPRHPWQTGPMSTPISIKDSVGEALRTARALGRFVLIVAGAGALAAMVGAVLGPLALLAIFVVLVTCHTALISAAFNGAAAVRARLLADAGRVGAAMAMVGLVIGFIIIAGVYGAMMVLIAPFADEVRAAGENQEQLTAIFNRAVESQPHVASIALAIGAALIFYITTRFYLAAPASVVEGRVRAFDSWRLTRGHTLKIMGARLMLLLPALVLVWALQSLLAVAFGFNTSDAAALLAQVQANPGLFFAIGLFAQIALYGALEAALSAALYRRIKPG